MEPKNKPHAVQCADAWLKDAGKPTYSDLLVALRQVWTPVEQGLPEKYCLAAYKNRSGKHRIIRAMYVKQYEIEATGDECDSEFNDADDLEYIKAGWYECIDNWGDYSSVKVCEGEVTHWMPLPPVPGEADTRPAANTARLSAAEVRANERIDAMHKGVVSVFAAIKAEHTPAAADAGRLSKNAVGAVPSSIAAVLPNGVAVTNVYDAYAAGLEQAAKDRAPATSAARLPPCESVRNAPDCRQLGGICGCGFGECRADLDDSRPAKGAGGVS